MKLFRSDILENLWLALATLRANKLRSFLTIIGVIIGVVTVMLIASIIVALASAVMYLIARQFLAPLQSILLALIFAFCTPAWSTASRALWPGSATLT